MKASNFYPSNYLKAEDLSGDTVFTIEDVESRDFKSEGVKPVLSFPEIRKQFIANKTNLTTIKNLYGDEMDLWKGKKIVLFPTSVDFKGEQRAGIRVRPWVPKEKHKEKVPEEDDNITDDDIPY